MADVCNLGGKDLKKNNANKRTLKGRIRKILFLTSTIIIISWGVICLFLIEGIIYNLSIFVTKYVSESIVESAIEKNVDIDEFIEISKGRDLYSVYNVLSVRENLTSELRGIARLEELTANNLEINMDSVLIDVNIDNKKFFSNSERVKNLHPIIEKIAKRYKDTESYHQIIDSDGEIIGDVTVKINPNLICIILVAMGTVVVVWTIISLVIVSIMIKIFTIPILNPLNQLENKMKAVAEGDFNECKDIKIELKKPLREIEDLITATNLITEKMQSYNRVIIEQKNELENQNLELEAQNEELIKSKEIIQEAQTQLLESEKMASIGQLTAAITHEINTPLGAINSNIQLFDMLLDLIRKNEKVKEEDELNNILAQLKQANDINLLACTRVNDIIKSLKNFSKLDQAEFQKANINENIDSVLVLTSNLWKNKITIHKDYGNIPEVNCFSVLLNQVFMNIIVNGIQAIDGQGDIFIKTYNNNDKLYISIKDTGIGIKEENLNRLFEFGFSTKKGDNGMGVGLAISYDIVKKHNGDIEVISKEGKGTEFIISIPLL